MDYISLLGLCSIFFALGPLIILYHNHRIEEVVRLIFLFAVYSLVSILFSFQHLSPLHENFLELYETAAYTVSQSCILFLVFFLHSLFRVNHRKGKNALVVLWIIFGIVLYTFKGHGSVFGLLHSMKMDDILSGLLLLYCFILIVHHRQSLKSPLNRKIILPFIILVLLFLPAFLFLSLMPMIQPTKWILLIFCVISNFFLGILIIFNFPKDPSANGEFTPLVSNPYNFSEREIDVVKLLLQGFSYARIADQLCISMSTVKSHAHSIYKKAKVASRSELAFLLSGISS